MKKPDGETISHLCQMIGSNTWNNYLCTIAEGYGYATRLREQINLGGFVTEKTMEEMQLAKAADELERLSVVIRGLHADLIENSKKVVPA